MSVPAWPREFRFRLGGGAGAPKLERGYPCHAGKWTGRDWEQVRRESSFLARMLNRSVVVAEVLTDGRERHAMTTWPTVAARDAERAAVRSCDETAHYRAEVS